MAKNLNYWASEAIRKCSPVNEGGAVAWEGTRQRQQWIRCVKYVCSIMIMIASTAVGTGHAGTTTIEYHKYGTTNYTWRVWNNRGWVAGSTVVNVAALTLPPGQREITCRYKTSPEAYNNRFWGWSLEKDTIIVKQHAPTPYPYGFDLICDIKQKAERGKQDLKMEVNACTTGHYCGNVYLDYTDSQGNVHNEWMDSPNGAGQKSKWYVQDINMGAENVYVTLEYPDSITMDASLQGKKYELIKHSAGVPVRVEAKPWENFLLAGGVNGMVVEMVPAVIVTDEQGGPCESLTTGQRCYVKVNPAANVRPGYVEKGNVNVTVTVM